MLVVFSLLIFCLWVWVIYSFLVVFGLLIFVSRGCCFVVRGVRCLLIVLVSRVLFLFSSELGLWEIDLFWLCLVCGCI